MDYLTVYFTIAAVLSQQALGRPEWHTYPHGPTTLPIVRHDGFLANTHEVEAAKQAHLAAVAAHDRHQSHDHPVFHISQEHTYIQPYQELTAVPVVLPSSQQSGASLVAAHYHQDSHNYHHLVNHANHGHEYIQSYHGPTAIPVVLPSGHLADTPEVALAKSHHLASVAQAKADKYYNGHEEYRYGGAYGYSGSHHGYGIPVVLPNGHIADTHEVAAAKSAHLLAVSKAKADKYYSGQGEGYGYGGGYGYSGSYHGYGIPVVLPNGHLADTKEVAAAKAVHLNAVAHAKAEQSFSNYHHKEYQHQEPQYVQDESQPHYVSAQQLPHYEDHFVHDVPHYVSHTHHTK